MNDLALYKIADNYLEALDTFTDPEQDIDESTVADTLEAIEGEIEEKAQNVVMYAKNIEATVTAIRDAEMLMMARRKRLESKIQWLMDYTRDQMERMDIQSISCPWFELKLVKNPPSVEITEDPPPAYQFTEVVIRSDDLESLEAACEIEGIHFDIKDEKVDKRGIKEWLKSGEKLDFARLKQTKRLSIK